LLLDELLQWELKLSDEQVDRLEGVEEKVRQRHQSEATRLTREVAENAGSSRALYQKERREQREVLLHLLSFAQAGRLKQIELQLHGPAAFDDPEVQKELGLTDAQKEAISKALRDAEQTYFDEARRLRRADAAAAAAGAAPPERRVSEEADKHARAFARQTLVKLAEHLNAYQQKRWATLRGEPCEALAKLSRGQFIHFFVNSRRDRRSAPVLDARQIAAELRDDLKLSAEQAARLAKLPDVIREGHKEEMGQLRKKGQELEKARAALEARQADEMAKAMTEVLTPEQRRRLKQVRLQSLGLAVWDDPSVRAALKLTASQQAAINNVRAEAKAKHWEMMQKASEEAYRESAAESPRIQQLRERKAGAAYRAFQKRAVAVLTPEQQKQWRELTGPHFRLRVDFTRP
jgi:hypothetical protein